MIRYVSKYCVVSQFAPSRMFADEAEARAFDRNFVVEALAATSAEAMRAAIERGDADFAKLLAFAADELDEGRYQRLATQAAVDP